MNKKVLMVHIPKCAGITTNNVIGLSNPLYVGVKYGHNYASKIKAEMGNEFDSLYKFSIVRNPWDKLWSGYNFMKHGSNFKGKIDSAPPTFKEYISNLHKGKRYLDNTSSLNGSDLYHHRQINWLFDNDGNQLVDKFYRFENLVELFEDLSKIMSDESIIDRFNKTRSNVTINKISYTEVYTEEMIQLVNEMYLPDITKLNYTFNG